MKYTKLFNNHSEYVAYIASESFIRPNVSYCIQEDESHCTPSGACIEQHIYEIMGDPSYPSSVPASATSFELSFTYTDTYTSVTCDQGSFMDSDTVTIPIEENPSTSARTISGTYIFHNISIPYSFTQEGITIVVADPVISCDGVNVTITCATQDASIYYQLDDSGSYTLYSTAIAITADTFVEAYATLSGASSTTVSATCEYNPTHDYSKDYLTFDVLTGGTIMWKANNNVTRTISYSINNGEWTEITSVSSGTPIDVSAGDKVRVKGTNERYATGKDAASMFSGGTASYNVEGNIMSLIGGDDFSGLTSFNGQQWAFHDLFNTSNIVSAKNLILPVTTLTNHCYRAMFAHSKKLTEAPELPATTLAASGYWYTFQECIQMERAPELLATTLVSTCYSGMFEKCSSLTYVKCLGTNPSDVCTASWLDNVSPTGTFVKAEAATGWSVSVSGIPSGWVVQNEGTPDIPTISCNGLEIELSCTTTGASIYYQLDHSGSYAQYTTAITMTGDTFIECYSEKDSHSSVTTSMTCEYDSRTIFEYSNQSIDTWTRSGSAVTVPNSVNAIDGHSSSYAKGTFNYEVSVNLRDAEPTYLWFQHADHKADIYVDNVLVDTHWGGYISFFSDISNYVHKGTNHIKVALKNNNGDYLAPAGGDFNFNATLGKVKLFTSPYMPAMNYGYDGFHITSTVSTGTATINVATSIPTGATVVCTISGVNCNYTATSASTGEEMIFSTTITNPRLWNGKIDPYLYNVKLEIYHDNELYHRYERPYGLRFYEYVIDDTVKYGTAGDPYTGFLLNGQPYLLRGCCMHDDIAGKANALDDTDYTNTFETIQELGLNFLRLAHYPHPRETYDWCDRLGIVVQTEGPCVNKLQSTMPTEYYDRLNGQYTDMVNQHYNHPCILFWGLSNETTTNDKAFGKTKIEGYTSLIKNLDSERMVGYVLAQSPGQSPSAYYNDPSNVDWFGCNIYVGWYTDTNSNNPTSQINTRLNNTIKRAGVNKPMAYSEYGCGGTQRCHSENFMSTTTRGNHERHDIEYMMWLHEGHIAAIKNFPQLLYTSQWQLFDIAVTSRQEGYIVCEDGIHTTTDNNLKYLNNKGLVERDHVTKKDTFYLYKAWWNTTDKFVHICCKDYTNFKNRVIKCYTNDGDSLTMYINGSSAETVTVTDNIATFTSRNFVNGDIVMVSGATSNESFTVSGITKLYDIHTIVNVTDTSNPTELYKRPSLVSSVVIDGVVQPSASGASAYTFSETGEHTVDYWLKTPSNGVPTGFCSGLTSVVSVAFDSDVPSIGERAFYGCSSITSITIGSGVTTIGNYVFKSCTNLVELTIPSNVTSIGTEAFRACSGLTDCTIEGNGSTSIGTSAFYDCSGLTSCTIGSGVTSIGASAFTECVNLPSIIIPNNVTTVGEYAFARCSGATYAIISTGMTEIPKACFTRCTGITYVTIPSNITQIKDYGFMYLYSLTSIDIPSSITSIGQSSFQNDSGLTSVVVHSTTPPTLGSSVFNGTNTCPIYVPCEYVDTYKEASGWTSYKARIQSMCVNQDYVEIGGIKWATKNVGANDISDYGLYYAWAETSGYTEAEITAATPVREFNWANYKYKSDSDTSPDQKDWFSKYGRDGRTILEMCDDAARVNMGGGWQIPSSEDYTALKNACNTAWTNDYQSSGASGLVFTDKTDSTKELFFPAAGYSWSYQGDHPVQYKGEMVHSHVNRIKVGEERKSYLLRVFPSYNSYRWGDYYDNRTNGISVRGIIKY